MRQKWTAVLLALALLVSSAALAEPAPGDLLRFVPTELIVEKESATVRGYFVNLNEDCDLKNLTDVNMSFYQDGTLLLSSSFGNINRFTVKAMDVKYQTFTFEGKHNLNPGHYICDDHFHVVFSCGFTIVS